MNRVLKLAGVALVALLLCSLPALALSATTDAPVHQSHALRWIVLGAAALGIAGTTVTYAYPGSGTVSATGAQAFAVQVQTAQVQFADADTTQVVTHNWGVGTTGAIPNTSKFMPEITLTWSSSGTAFPALSVAWTDGNTITLTKGNTSTGSGGTVVVTMRRPHSTGQ